MRLVLPSALVVAVCSLAPAVSATCLAQTPDSGMLAAGAEVGPFFPDDEFDGSVLVGGSLDFYLAPRVSLRGSLSYTASEFERGTDDEVQQFRLGVDAIYNWEHGKWHPFAGAGFGVHFLELNSNDTEIDSDTEAGFALLGGIEYFLTRRATFKGEVRYQFAGDSFGTDPSGLALTFGLKAYFGG